MTKTTEEYSREEILNRTFYEPLTPEVTQRKWRKMSRVKFLFIALVIVAVVALIVVLTVIFTKHPEEITFKSAAVTSNGKECAAIGRDTLAKGGSIADAAIATMFCEGVTCAQCMGLGGGFLLTMYQKSTNTVLVLDSRETAPGAAHPDMFEGGNISTTLGGMAVAVPAELKGYEALYRRFGKLPWADLVQPTIDLCKNGYTLTEYFARVLKERTERVKAEPSLRETFINPATNEVWLEGDKVKRPKLAATLEIIAKQGVDALYNGSLTKQFLADIREHNGIITAEDLLNYKPVWHDPVSVSLGSDMTLHSVPLSGSGHLLAFLLNTIRGWAISTNVTAADVEENSVPYWQRIVEAFKYTYAMRTSLGDPDFLNPDVLNPLLANLTSLEHSKYIRSLVSDNRTYNDWAHYGAEFEPVEDHGTAHVSILAANGDAIAATSTINFIFGAFFKSSSTGIILNNEMDDFSYPNISNVYGLPPSPSNFARPGKRPLSSMVPAIVVTEGKGVRLIVGAAGGTKITTQVALIVLKHLVSGTDLAEAMDAPRLHHQLFPMEIQHESDFDEEILKGLRKIGHKTEVLGPTAGFAALTAISVDHESGLITPRFDKRRKGSVAGF